MKVYISGNLITNYRPYSVSVQDSLNERSTGSLDIVVRRDDERYTPGQPIEIYDDTDNLIFGGFIDRPRERRNKGSEVINLPVDLVDNQSIADRRIIAESYKGVTIGSIVRDILAKYLAVEGVTEGVVADGQTVEGAVFPYIYASQALDELSELSGMYWNITADKRLNFTHRETFTAPWQIDESSPIRDVSVERNQDKYRNRQYIRAGQDITDSQTERSRGDGDTQTFIVGYRIAQVPTVTVNGVSQTVGIRGLDDGRQWYWSKNEKEITQDREGIPLSNDDVIEITYVGFFPIIVVSEDSSAIDERRSLSGGSGIIEAAEENRNLDNSDSALEFSQGKLRRYARINTKIKFETDKAGLKSGQMVTVDLPIHSVSGTFLITSVTVSEYTIGKLRFDVEMVDGEAVGGWANFFKELAEKGRTFVIRENEVLVRLSTQNERVGWGESQTYKINACSVPSENLFPSDDLIPC